MSESPPDVDDLGLDELRKLVVQLLERIAVLMSENAALRDEIARLKGLKGRPKLKPSGMEKATEPRRKRRTKRRKGKRAKLVIHEERIITVEVPAGSRFKGYEDFVVQELVIRPRVIRFRRERWLTRDGQTLVAALPAWVEGGIAARRSNATCWLSTTRARSRCRVWWPNSTTSACASPSATSSGS